jgi:hypothetical protein
MSKHYAGPTDHTFLGIFRILQNCISSKRASANLASSIFDFTPQFFTSHGSGNEEGLPYLDVTAAISRECDAIE